METPIINNVICSSEEMTYERKRDLALKSWKRGLRNLQRQMVNALLKRDRLMNAYAEIQSASEGLTDTMLRDCIYESLGLLSAVICDFELNPIYWEKRIKEYRTTIDDWKKE